MYCTNCGKQNTDDTKFCIGCGKPVVNKGTVQNDGHTNHYSPESNTAYINPQFTDATRDMASDECAAASESMAVNITGQLEFQPVVSQDNVKKPVKRISTKLIVMLSITFVVVGALVIFRNQVLGGSCYVIAQVMQKLNSGDTLGMAKQAVDYDNVEAYRKFVSSIYTDKAKPYIETDPSNALDMLLQANDYYEDKDTSDLIGQAYVNKADKVVDSDPDDAVRILSSAKKYVPEDTVKTVLQKAAVKIIDKNSNGAAVINVTLNDLDGDGSDEIIGLYSDTVEVYTNKNDKFISADKESVNLNGFVSMEMQNIINEKENQIIIKSKSSGYNRLDILRFSDNQLTTLFSTYANISIDIQDSGSGAKKLLVKNNQNDFERHLVEKSYKWESGAYKLDTMNVSYESGSFVYPLKPGDVAACYMQAVALGMQDEINAMTFTTDNRYDDLFYDAKNVDYLFDLIHKGDNFEITYNYNEGSRTYEYDELYNRVDYTVNGYSNSAYIYLVNPGSQWMVYAASSIY